MGNTHIILLIILKLNKSRNAAWSYACKYSTSIDNMSKY